MQRPWNDWYHCICTTYGTWLLGDPRGFRIRHHRFHCDGDYKSPPPTGTFDRLYRRSLKLMKRPPVHLKPDQIPVILYKFVNSFQKRRIELIVASLDDHHLHLLARFPDHRPRHWLGIAKKESAFGSGGLWAVRSKIGVIRDRRHQVAVAKYIWRQGAARWRVPPKRPGNVSSDFGHLAGV